MREDGRGWERMRMRVERMTKIMMMMVMRVDVESG